MIPPLLTSLLFSVPAIYAPCYSEVMYGSLACLGTSVINHWYLGQHWGWNIFDRITVIPTAAFFISKCAYVKGVKKEASLVYGFALLASLVYLYLSPRPELYLEYHGWVHVLAITGIMFYIRVMHRRE